MTTSILRFRVDTIRRGDGGQSAAAARYRAAAGRTAAGDALLVRELLANLPRAPMKSVVAILRRYRGED